MGKGDKRSKKGKRFRGSYGVRRPKKPRKSGQRNTGRKNKGLPARLVHE